MGLSFFLAKLIGLYFVIMAAMGIFRKEQFLAATKSLMGCDGAMVVSGVFSLIFGLFIAIDHSVWTLNWMGLVTLIGYLCIFQGIMRLSSPKRCKKFATRLTQHRGFFVGALLVVGLYLAYNGFSL